MNLNKRLEAIEAIHAPKKELPLASVATIEVNGKVELTHAKHETIHLQNREALQQFIDEHDLQDWQVLIVEYVNAQGEPPIQL